MTSQTWLLVLHPEHNAGLLKRNNTTTQNPILAVTPPGRKERTLHFQIELRGRRAISPSLANPEPLKHNNPKLEVLRGQKACNSFLVLVAAPWLGRVQGLGSRVGDKLEDL